MGDQRRVHGESRSRRVGKRTIMKSLLFVAAFLAMALAAHQQADQPAESGPNPEAEADPWYGYYGYGYRPYGYGYYGYRPYGYYGYYGKRSADEGAAESGPNANAEADPWYGYYGHYYRPYGYGYYGHGFYGYAYWG